MIPVDGEARRATQCARSWITRWRYKLLEIRAINDGNREGGSYENALSYRSLDARSASELWMRSVSQQMSAIRSGDEAYPRSDRGYNELGQVLAHDFFTCSFFFLFFFFFGFFS